MGPGRCDDASRRADAAGLAGVDRTRPCRPPARRRRAPACLMASPVFPIRLLALDIDGTLVGDNLALRDRTIAAVRGAVERGVSVSLVTGRMATSAREFADVLGLTEPIVAAQGAVIREGPKPGQRGPGRLLVHSPLAADVAREALLWSRDQLGLDPHLNHLEKL